MLLNLLNVLHPDITPKNTKVHFAQHNSTEHPMDVYLAGKFDEWQSWQSNANFECEYVIGLIEVPNTKTWLLAGVYDQIKGTPKTSTKGKEYVSYEMRRMSEFAELDGRLVVHYKKAFRQPYPWLKTALDGMVVSAILEKPMTVGEFPGFKEVDITHGELKVIAKQNMVSWRTALCSVAGVYLISDNTKGEQLLYVGSATGIDGLWNRWMTYSNNGHGGNKRLQALKEKRGENFAENFKYSILEIADKHTGKEEMLQKEIHWKRRLLTRDSGLNGN